MKPFRFGVQYYAPTSPDDFREKVRRAEDLGYSAFHLADHYIGSGPALAPTNHPVQTVAAIPAMAIAAEITSSIRIGCLVLCVDYHNPTVLAKEVATLDWFSGGRLEVGLGAGWVANEYEAMGVPFRPAGERVDKLEEMIGLLHASFGDDQVDVAGKHIYAVGYDAQPKPAQQPRPPILVGGGSRRILGVAGRLADIVGLNFNNSAGRLGPEGFGSGTRELTEQKIQWIKDGAGDRFDQLELAISAYFTAVVDDAAGAREKMGARLGLSPDAVAEHGHALIGSVDEICDTLVERRERLGISYITVGAPVMDAFAPVVARLAGT